MSKAPTLVLVWRVGNAGWDEDVRVLKLILDRQRNLQNKLISIEFRINFRTYYNCFLSFGHAFQIGTDSPEVCRDID